MNIFKHIVRPSSSFNTQYYMYDSGFKLRFSSNLNNGILLPPYILHDVSLLKSKEFINKLIKDKKLISNTNMNMWPTTSDEIHYEKW